MINKDNEQDDFNIKYKEIIEKLYLLFKNDINERQSSRIIKILIGIPCLTIFEAFNLIYREIQIIKTISNNETNIEENMIILENKNSDKNIYVYEPEEFNKIIEKYKIKSDDNNLEESWKPINEYDERRKIKINKNNNIYNYLPIKPEYIYLENNNKKELYSKNENEYLYHPLFYKTIMCHYCKNTNNSNKFLCPYSHDIQKDFRIIYDYQNDDICKFLNFLYNNKLLSFINHLNYIPIEPIKFEPNQFKIFKCPFKKCPVDKHLCPFYHSSEEQRRPPLLFRYNVDDKCFDEKNKKYKVEECPLGIFCYAIHSQYEYNYHPKIFRKEIECKKEKINGHCKYIKTCYGKHPEEEYEIYKKELEEDNTKKIISEDEDIKKIKEKMESINNICECLKCRNCNKMANKGRIKYLCECKHFLCKKCFEEIYNEGDKICPFCENKITKKNYINLYFNRKSKKD